MKLVGNYREWRLKKQRTMAVNFLPDNILNDVGLTRSGKKIVPLR